MSTVKFIGSWACIVATIVIMVLDRSVSGLAIPLSLLSVAFALAPTSG